jgi:peptidoglycan hydrolase-like protein with peptidoglycan-binding domain
MPIARISAGTYGIDVANLHATLQSLGFDIPVTESSRSYFGAATALAVRQFQQNGGLAPSGVVDDQTANALTKQLALGRAQASQSSPSASFATGSTRPALYNRRR